MSAHFEDPERRVIPRWRPSWVTAALGELRSFQTEPGRRSSLDRRGLLENLAAWERQRSPVFAADLVGTALALGEYALAREAAECALASASQVGPAAARLARHVLGVAQDPLGAPPSVSRDDRRRRISLLRRRLHSGPRDALAWMDLAREYAVLGQSAPAERATRMALSVAPDNRFVLRSASRFFLHQGDPEQANLLLRRAARTQRDPWLLAAEIAAASVAGWTSGLVRPARGLIASGNFAVGHVSELACAVATLEMHGGKRSEVRRLFGHALIQPTENAVAQASWAARQVTGLLEIDPSVYHTARSFEARAWERFAVTAWAEALEEAREWQLDEPFATRAAAFGSFVAAVGLDDFESSAAFARAGLEANPGDFLLLNNLAFALANGGRVREAREVFARIRRAGLDSPQQAMYLATSGLLSYRAGRVQEGRVLYESAIESATAAKARETRAWATLFHAREQLLAGAVDRMTILSNAELMLQELPAISRPIAKHLFDQLVAGRFPRISRVKRTPGISTVGSGFPRWGRRLLNALLRTVGRAWRRKGTPSTK